MVNEITGNPIPLTDAVHLFCLGYHMKGVCNSNCGIRKKHRHLSSSDPSLLTAFKARLCGMAPPPVLVVNTTSLGGTKFSMKNHKNNGSQGG